MVGREQHHSRRHCRWALCWRRQIRALLHLRRDVKADSEAEQHGGDGAIHSQGRQDRARTVLLPYDRALTAATIRADAAALTDEAFIAPAASGATDAASVSRVASPSQRQAIEAAPQPLLVIAGPGAGKTFCLIERVRYLIEQLEFDPVRTCVFTFTNKAAGEIAERLQRELGDR